MGTEARRRQQTKTYLMAGIALAILAAVYLLPAPEGLPPEGLRMIGIALIAALFWSTEVVPIPVTALLIIFLQSTLGVLPLNVSLGSIAHPVNSLIFVGFVLSAGLEKFGLDRQISVSIIKIAGRNVRKLLFAMMAIVAVLSMWMSNTSTVALVVPIVLSMLAVSKGDNPNMKRAFLIGIAYAGTIGGIATPVGTPPNPITIGFLSEMAGINVSFLDWILIGMPFTVILLPLAWLTLILMYPPEVKEIDIPDEALVLEETQHKKSDIRRFGFIFATIVILWVAESFMPVPANWLYLVAIGGSIAMCLPIIGVLSWKELSREVNWGVLILIGGGLAMGTGLKESGVIDWLVNNYLLQLGNVSTPVLIIIVAGVTSLSIMFFCSITATSTAFVPLAISLAIQLNANPLIVAAAAGIASSFAYLLPANTPPNAIAYASGHFTTKDMMKAGIVLLALSIVVFVLISQLLWPLIF
ncbi:MAG: DASS family sodium-coupled anion symporter [Spirochaetaceae bacterium]|nr:MAG: DASS family sodium-coupled anion symporter [Spirochaetaceae bacterium]